MAKPFDIHNWQADQRTKLLKESPSSELSKLINSAIISLDPDMPYMDFAKGVAQVLIDEYGTHNYDPFIKELKTILDNEKANLQKAFDDEVNEHHAGDYKPGFLKQYVNTFLDKLKKKTKEGKDYKTVEKIMEKYFSAKKANEASMTGTGASFTPGASAAYATPKAFGDNKRKKKKGYMGYKEI